MILFYLFISGLASTTWNYLISQKELLVEVHPPMVLTAENGQVVRVRPLVAHVAQRLAAGGGAGVPVVLTLVPVPPVAGVNEREPLRNLFAAG